MNNDRRLANENDKEVRAMHLHVLSRHWLQVVVRAKLELQSLIPIQSAADGHPFFAVCHAQLPQMQLHMRGKSVQSNRQSTMGHCAVK